MYWLILLGGLLVYNRLLVYLRKNEETELKNMAQKLLLWLSAIHFTLVARHIILSARDTDFVSNHKVLASVLILVISFGAVLMIRKVNPVSLICSGSFLNIVVFMSNDWTMPVFKGWDVFYGHVLPPDIGALHSPMTASSKLAFLGDYINFSLHYFGVGVTNYSPGDLLIAMGLLILFKKLSSMFAG